MASAQFLAPTGLDDLFPRGADSYSDQRLPPGSFVRSWNCSIRGGILRSRPGTDWKYNLPGGKPQGFFVYTPRRGHPQHVAVVGGKVYVSDFPFSAWRVLPGIQLDPLVRKAYFAQSIQAIQRNTDGSLAFLDIPLQILTIQDGVSAPAWYDGHDHGHDTNTDGCPLGTAMASSGGRLWVARDNRVFSSDIFNPRSFVEQFYLGLADSLFMPERVTAMTDVQGAGLVTASMLVFGPNTTTSVATGLSRETWRTTPGFQNTFLPSVGCVSARSVAYQNGKLWWMSQRGVTALDVATRAMQSAALPTLDNEMGFSKCALDDTGESAAAVAFDNLLAMSVPYGSAENTHTWIYDASIQNQLGTDTAGWASVWTGFRPVQWGRYVDGAEEHVFCLATNELGQNIVLEANVGTRDSGQDIESRVELRAQTAGTPLIKELKRIDLHFSGIEGDLDVAVEWRGFSRGRYKRCGTWSVRAARGCFQAGVNIGSMLYQSHPQWRRFSTEDPSKKADGKLSTTGNQSPFREALDFSFTFMVIWVGPGALREVAPHMVPQNETPYIAPAPESAPTFTRFDGASSKTEADLQPPAPAFAATRSYTGTARGVSASAARSAFSWVNDDAAGRMAEQAAQSQVRVLLDTEAPALVGLGG